MDLMYHVSHYINGQKVYSDLKKQAIVNPATGEEVGHVEFADKAIIDKAVAAAKEAFVSWSSMTPLKRARIISQYKCLLEQHMDSLAEIITREHGKTLTDARSSIQRGIDVVEFACGIPNLLKGSYSDNVATDMDCYSFHQPLGVCVGITPFNFPAMIPLWMFPLAIACGNTFVLKPSEKDPSASILLAELAKEAGVPDGVINVVHGDKTAVDLLLMHPDVQAVSSVGSTPVAEYIYQTAAKNGKRVQAFGGAKNHCLVMPDANLNEAVNAIVGAAYGSAGERCMAIPVVVALGDALADQMIATLKPAIEALKVGRGTEADIEMGPLVTEAHWNRVNDYIKLGIDEGARLVVDGRRLKGKGFFMSGTLFDNVTSKMKIYQEEIFGPVLCIVRVPNFEAGLSLINAHPFGNGTAIFTSHGETARQFTMQVQAGMVGINSAIPVPVAYHSFGGWKRSMFGDLGMYGTDSILFYTKLKKVTQRWFHSTTEAEFTMPTH